MAKQTNRGRYYIINSHGNCGIFQRNAAMPSRLLGSFSMDQLEIVELIIKLLNATPSLEERRKVIAILLATTPEGNKR